MGLVGTKSALSSLTINGAIVTLIPTLLKLFGVDLGSDIGPILDTVVQGFGAGMVVYGRTRATTKIA